MTSNCSNCVHAGVKQVQLNGGIACIEKCNRTGCSAAWERAAMIQGDIPVNERVRNGRHHPLFVADHPNCGPAGQFFSGKSRSAVA